MTASKDQLTLVITLNDLCFEASGPSAVVLDARDQFLTWVDDHEGRLGRLQADGHETDGKTGGDPPQPVPAIEAGNRPPLPVFLKQRDLDTNALRAAAIVVWAQRYEGLASMTPSEVMDMWKRTPMKVPGNLARDLGVAASQGWVESVDHGEYAATGYGASEVDSRVEAAQEAS